MTVPRKLKTRHNERGIQIDSRSGLYLEMYIHDPRRHGPSLEHTAAALADRCCQTEQEALSLRITETLDTKHEFLSSPRSVSLGFSSEPLACRVIVHAVRWSYDG